MAAWWFSMPAGRLRDLDHLHGRQQPDQGHGPGPLRRRGQLDRPGPGQRAGRPQRLHRSGRRLETPGHFKLTNNIFHISTWNSATDGAICVNGIQLRAAPVIDDGDAPNVGANAPLGVGNFTTTGAWTISTQGAFGGSQASSSTAGSGASTATWTMPVTPGCYEVDVTWPASAQPVGQRDLQRLRRRHEARLGGRQPADGPQRLELRGSELAVAGQLHRHGHATDGDLGQHGRRRPGRGRRHPHSAGLSAHADRQQRISGLLEQQPPGPPQNTGLYGDSLVSNSANGSEQSQAAWWFPCRPGKYEVQVTWQPGGNLSQSAVRRLQRADLDQRRRWSTSRMPPGALTDQGVVWQSLGIFTMTSNVLHVSTWNSPTDGAMCVDGVRIVPVSGVHLSEPIGDGSFEAPALPAGSFQDQPAGSPWQFTTGAGIGSNGSSFASASGTRNRRPRTLSCKAPAA